MFVCFLIMSLFIFICFLLLYLFFCLFVLVWFVFVFAFVLLCWLSRQRKWLEDNIKEWTGLDHTVESREPRGVEEVGCKI